MVLDSATKMYTARTDDTACSVMAPGRVYYSLTWRAKPMRMRPYRKPGTTSTSMDGSATSASHQQPTAAPPRVASPQSLQPLYRRSPCSSSSRTHLERRSGGSRQRRRSWWWWCSAPELWFPAEEEDTWRLWSAEEEETWPWPAPRGWPWKGGVVARPWKEAEGKRGRSRRWERKRKRGGERSRRLEGGERK
nr:unnamed protein product [Digitaria exilis]